MSSLSTQTLGLIKLLTNRLMRQIQRWRRYVCYGPNQPIDDVRTSARAPYMTLKAHTHPEDPCSCLRRVEVLRTPPPAMVLFLKGSGEKDDASVPSHSINRTGAYPGLSNPSNEQTRSEFPTHTHATFPGTPWGDKHI